MSNELDNPFEPKTSRNMDVVGIVERIDRYAYDICKFESATQNQITEYDMARIQQYNAALRTYVATLNDANKMDLPHSFPAMYDIRYLCEDGGIDIDEIKNKAIRDIVRLYVNCWVQWSRSESADASNGFHPADYTRFLLIMDRIDYYIQSYIEQALPLDLPESSAFEDGDYRGSTSAKR